MPWGMGISRQIRTVQRILNGSHTIQITASDGKLTMERRFQLVRARDKATILRGHWHLVCVELSSGKPRRMPEAFCRIYLAALTAP